jgi:hypothetical protein
MSIQPIDLQVLFARLNQIGREQVANKNMLIQAQAVAANEIALRSEEQDRRVGNVNIQQEGPEKLSDEGENAETPSEQQREQEASESESDQEVLQDPDLGQNIDISG